MHYVYLLKSLARSEERYVGSTTDLRERLADHNAGRSSHTAKFKPWTLVTYVAFSDKSKAEQFERYLKSGSGHSSDT
jgi:predicted GIY-YIG superfamily endonuclease